MGTIFNMKRPVKVWYENLFFIPCIKLTYFKTQVMSAIKH